MKKAVVLGMILLALGTFAFADGGVTVGMDFGRTQFNIANGATGGGANTVLGDNTASTAILQNWGPGLAGFPQGERIDFQFAWSNQYTGVNSTFYIGNDKTNPTAISVVNLYGTLKLVPDMFTIYIGEFNGDGWDHFRMDSNHPIHDVNNANVGRFGGWGMILDLMPKDTGFEVAAFAKTADPTVKGNTITQQLSQYAVAASYTVPNMVKVIAGTNTFGLYSDTEATSVIGLTTPAERNIFASVSLLMVPNLTLWDEAYLAGFDMNFPSGTSYGPNALSTYTIWSNEVAAQYVMDKLTIVLAAFIGSNSAGGSPDYPYQKTADVLASTASASLRAINLNKDYIAWAIDPEVYYNAGVATVGIYGSVSGNTTDSANTEYLSGISYYVEPYVKLNNFGLRVSFGYSGGTASNHVSQWEVPILIDWGF